MLSFITCFFNCQLSKDLHIEEVNFQSYIFMPLNVKKIQYKNNFMHKEFLVSKNIMDNSSSKTRKIQIQKNIS